jgi:MFS family permease
MSLIRTSTTGTTATPAAAGVMSAVGFLVVLEFASGLLQGWLPPLLPSILREYGLTAADTNWVNGVYLLSTAVCLPLMAKLGDVYGHRRLLIVAVSLVAAGAVLVAIAPTFEVLLLGRALQGPLMAFLPLEFAIVRERAGDRAPRAIGLLIGALAVGGGLGLLLAGVLRDHLSLSATLWIPAVVLVATVPVTVLLVPETTVRTPGPVDWTGAALLAVGLVLLLAAVGNGGTWGWTDPRTLVGLVGGPAVLVAWVLFERQVASPLVDLPLVLRGGLGLPILAGLFFGAELFGAQVASALFLGLPRSTGFGLGLTAGQLGFVLLAFGVAAFVGTVLAPRIAERASSRAALLAGALVTAAGYLLTALLHDAVAAVVAWQVLVGLGNGIVLATLSVVVVTRAPADAVGISAGLFNTARTVGGAVSVAVFAAVMAAILTPPSGTAKRISAEASYVTVWVVCAVLALVVAGLALRLPRHAAAAGAEPVTAPTAG